MPPDDPVLSMMSKPGMTTAPAGVMLRDSGLVDVLFASLVLLIRKRRAQRAAS